MQATVDATRPALGERKYRCSKCGALTEWDDCLGKPLCVKCWDKLVEENILAEKAEYNRRYYEAHRAEKAEYKPRPGRPKQELEHLFNTRGNRYS